MKNFAVVIVAATLLFSCVEQSKLEKACIDSFYVGYVRGGKAMLTWSNEVKQAREFETPMPEYIDFQDLVNRETEKFRKEAFK